MSRPVISKPPQVCTTCRETFTPSAVRLHHCSLTCSLAGKKNPLVITCPVCGVRKVVERNGKTTPRYCSRSCALKRRMSQEEHRDRVFSRLHSKTSHAKATASRVRKVVKRVETSCANCGKCFQTTRQYRHRTCSRACRYKLVGAKTARRHARHRVVTKCVACGKVKGRAATCSRACAAKVKIERFRLIRRCVEQEAWARLQKHSQRPRRKRTPRIAKVRKTTAAVVEARVCVICGKNFDVILRAGVKVRATCSHECARKLAGEKTSKRAQLNPRKSPASAERMRRNNPMRIPANVEKMRVKLKGRTFLARGGNGQITKQQQVLADALPSPVVMEYAVSTLGVHGQFPSLPTHFKVDLAYPELRLAIEVDGKTHKLPKWKFLDRRKTSILNALGWCVLRFWNAEIDTDLPRVIATIRAMCMILKSQTITTT